MDKGIRKDHVRNQDICEDAKVYIMATFMRDKKITVGTSSKENNISSWIMQMVVQNKGWPTSSWPSYITKERQSDITENRQYQNVMIKFVAMVSQGEKVMMLQ